MGQPEPDWASDASSLPNQGWLGQDGLRRLHSKKGLTGTVGQFTTRDVDDSEVLPSQQGELGQGWLSKQIGQSGAESLACSVVGQSGAESLACSVVGQSGVESLACSVVGQSGAESLACSVVGQSGIESLACLEKSPTEGVGVRFSGPAMVRAGVTGGGPEKQSGPDSRETNRVPIRASCIAGVGRLRK